MRKKISKQRRKVYSHKYYLKHKQRILKNNKKWGKKHPLKKRLYVANYKIKNRASVKWSSLKMRIKRTNYKVIMTKEEFISWYNKQEKKCYYCSIPEVELKNNKAFKMLSAYLTIDRKNNKKNYTIKNIVLCCSRCNLIKSNFFTEKEMLEIGKKYVAIKRL